MSRALLLAFSFACLSTLPAWAQAPAPAAAAARAAPGEGVEYLIGRWKASAEDPQTGEVMSIDYRVEPLPGGAWAAGSGVSSDQTLKSSDVWGRDPLTGEIVRVIFDGSGAFATVRSPGWAGDRLVLEGEVRSRGGVLRVRESITRLGPDKFRAVWEAFRNGKWVAYSVETVTRQT